MTGPTVEPHVVTIDRHDCDCEHCTRDESSIGRTTYAIKCCAFRGKDLTLFDALLVLSNHLHDAHGVDIAPSRLSYNAPQLCAACYGNGCDECADEGWTTRLVEPRPVAA